MTTWTDEEALRLDIAMALSKIKTKPRGDREDIYRKMVAEQIVAHLKLCNWQFVKGPPQPLHGQPRRASRVGVGFGRTPRSN